MCIAPVLIARCIPGAAVTIGTDRDTAFLIEEMGGRHIECPASEAVADPDLRIVTTPAYMTAAGPEEVYRGAVEMVRKLDSLVSPS
jgi:enhancing lycopene biosynthesis protein 2